MELTSPAEIKRIAAKYGFTFKKGLGQNFLTSQSILEEIAEAAEPDEGVLEIGPGFGVLTNELAKRAEKVVALEIDDRLIPVLADTLSEHKNVKIINKDVMKVDLRALINDEFGGKHISIAANLPYYITTPIITTLIESELSLKNLVVMVQKEVAERIQAKPSTKAYGALTILCQFYTDPEIIKIVPAGLFMPPPNVDSAVLRMRFLDEPRVKVKDRELFFKTVKAAFSQRRKTLLNCLASGFGIGKDVLSEIMSDAGIESGRRGETLDMDEFAALADAIYEYKQSR